MSRQVSMTTLGIGLLGAVIVGAAGYFFVAPMATGNQVDTYPVRLTQKGDTGLEVSVRDNKQKCETSDNKGCMQFPEDKIGLIKFYLDGSKFKNKGCDKDKEVITKIELTTTGIDDKGTFGNPLDPWIRNDAFPGVNLLTGIVYEALPANGRTQVFLANMNSNDASDDPKIFWYRVTVSACPEESGGPWVTDPRGVNKGTN
jgi:hypothetical protein